MRTNKLRIEYLLLLIIFIFCHSCEFEPSEVYNRPVTNNSTPAQIQILELNLNEDTVYLNGDKTIRFRFQSSNQKIKKVSYFIDGIEIGSQYSDTGVFYIDHEKLSTGIHSLEIKVYTGSGTGSIGDLIGTEGYLFTKSWILIVEENYRNSCKSTIINGFLHISWDAYKVDNIKEYIVYKYLLDRLPIEMMRLKSTQFTDSSYVGEGGGYRIVAITTTGTQISYSDLTLTNQIPKISFRATKQNEYFINWEKTKYYNAAGSFELYQRLYMSGTYELINSTQDINDTLFIHNTIKFGDKAYIKLRIVPKKKNIMFSDPYYSYFENELLVKFGYPFYISNLDINDFHQISATQFICVSYSDSLVKYSVSLNKVIQRISYSAVGCVTSEFHGLSSSPSGKIISSYVGCNDDVMLTNTSNLQSYQVKSLKSLTGSQYVPAIPVSDNGICLVNSLSSGFYIYDFYNSITLAQYPKNVKAITISKNGNYIFVYDDSIRFIKFANSKFSEIRSISLYDASKLKYIEYNGSDPDQLVIWDGSTFSIKLCTDFSNVNEYSLTDEYILNIDYYNLEMLTYNSGHLLVRDFKTGSIKHDIVVGNFYYGSYGNYFLINHTLVCVSGMMYFLN